MTVMLQGLTWDHPRAWEGLEAETRRLHAARPDIRLTWDRHSLRGFETRPIIETAEAYDLIILDHPFMGDAVASGCLLDLSRLDGLDGLLRDDLYIGPSMPSYRMGGGAWAMPIDAACQVAARAPDRIDIPPATLAEVAALAGRRPIALAMACPHAFMNFLSIAGMTGADIAGGPEALLPRDTALAALETLRELAALADPASARWSSIDALDALARTDGPDYCPMVFAFNSYARGSAGTRRLRFGPLPLAGDGGPVAGGTGLALSARLAGRPAELAAALDVAGHFAGAGAQTAMACDGGQPARVEAWDDPAADAANGGFLSDCRASMARARLRPRHAGYMALQNGAGDLLLDAAFDRSRPAGAVIDAIDALYRRTRAAGSVYGR